MLNNIRFADELRSYKELDLPAKGTESVNEKELDLAVKLIDQLTEKWNPTQYKDTYFEELKKILNEKIEGKTPSPIKPEVAHVAVTDLFSRLNQSLEIAKAKEKKAA
jgi:DNA end-binding protein Ku